MFYPREAEKDHLFTRVILLTFACCFVLMLAGMSRHEGLRYAAIQLSPVDITGTVTQLEEIRMNPNGKIIHYRYTDPDGKVHDDQYVDQRYAQKTAYEPGGSIALLVSGWLPAQNSIASELNGNRPGFYILLVSVALALWTLEISFKTMGRIYAMKEEDRFY
ncbi:hypothetical protein [Pseudomonas sp. NPDC086278]|uniref:hypothetical protein n=1 Tax=Pseudomonas sp. NPDC086278 TaxID=3390646 RepID=UPI003CFD8E0E